MKPITVLNQANVPMGPFTRLEVDARLRKGEFSLNSLAFVEGLSRWTPLREILARADASAAPPVVATPLIAPPASASPFDATPLTAPPAAVPAYSYAATMQPPPHLAYGGFWLRFVAYLIDGLILSVVIFGAAFVIAMIFIIMWSLIWGGTHMHWGATGLTEHEKINLNGSSTNPATVMMIALVELVIWGTVMAVTWLYFAKLESGPRQATYGKQIMGLRVTDLEGQRIGFGRASGRFFGKIISALPMDIGFIMAGFTERKQALHDMLAGTLVVRN